MAELTQKTTHHNSHGMGMHQERLIGRTQQVFLSPEEEENFVYPDAPVVDFAKQSEFDAAQMDTSRNQSEDPGADEPWGRAHSRSESDGKTLAGRRHSRAASS